MICYILHLARVDDERVSLLREACFKLKIPFKAINPLSWDFSKPSPVKAGDILYRVSRGKLLQAAEKYFLTSGVRTFYKDGVVRRPDPFVFSHEEIPTPKTIFCPTKKRDQIKMYVKKLGGFPLILKTVGGSHGLGVMKVETLSSLFSIVDYLLSQKKFILLEQYIPVTTSARFIVVGNEVVSSIEYHASRGDFRSNEAVDPTVRSKKYSKELESLAVRATHAYGWEFGGVDMLIHKGKPYVTEVNFPCNFARAQGKGKTDIAMSMIQYLKDKMIHE